ncbi:MAG: hypothetical protein WBA74_11725, partial [Cyclobacteriaceae bacterium]
LKSSKDQKLKELRDEQFNQQEPPPFFPPEEELKEQSKPLDKLIRDQERESLRMLINYGASLIEGPDDEQEYLVSYFFSEIEDVTFETPIYNEILEICKDKFEKGEIVEPEYLLEVGSEAIKSTVVDLVTDKYDISEFWQEKFEIYVPRETDILKNATYSNIVRLKFRIIQKLVKENQDKLKNAKDEEEELLILDTFSKLKKMQMQIAAILGNVTT